MFCSVLNEPGGLDSRQPHYRQFAFTGLMRCGECGSGITAESKTKECKNGNVHHYTYPAKDLGRKVRSKVWMGWVTGLEPVAS